MGSHDDFDSVSLLRDDDSLLRQIFFSTLRHHHPKLANKIDVVYALSQAWCTSHSDDEFTMLEGYLKKLAPEEMVLIASSLSHMLNLHNLSEEVSAAQTGRKVRLGEVSNPTRTTNKSLLKLISENGYSPEELYKNLCKQTVELVLTAHPTQALRGSLLKKYATIRKEMDNLHTQHMSNFEKTECLDAIKASVQAAWRTDEIRRLQPSPQDEARGGMAYFNNAIFDVIPVFHRRIDTALANLGLPKLPLTHSLFKFGSWMGGDRDGNPNVTSETTRDVVIIARLEAVNMYFKSIEALIFDLSIWRCSPELKAYAIKIAGLEERDSQRVSEERKKRNYADFWMPVPLTEPFRVVLSHIRDHLYVTRDVLHQCLALSNMNMLTALHERDAYTCVEELYKPLKVMYDSLLSTGDESVANARLLDLLRQVRTFEFGLTKLDVRQESTRHAEVMKHITEYLGLGSYASWDETTRTEFLEEQLKGKRPLFPPGMEMSDEAQEVVATIRMLAELPSDSLGAYVISMARTTSDVLAVTLLQRECGVRTPLRVVPLFETLDDLNNAPATMKRLFASEWYMNHIKGSQECMIGYSDSGKDAGRLAAAWALFEAQEKLSEVAKEADVELILFHGRGGTVCRGGGPTHLAVLSQPAGTINGKLRVTVQGEIIEQQFGEKEVCFRTLDTYTSAVLEAGLDAPPAPKQSWRDMMSKLSTNSCAEYRNVVFERPEFIEYFQKATPVSELGRLNIGSRPAKRPKASQGVESLRAIPWIFAWTQTRMHLPVWLGIGRALQAAIDDNQMDVLKEMYTEWPFFKGTVDLIEMVLAKADPKISTLYEKTLVPVELWSLGDELRSRLTTTRKTILTISSKTKLLEADGVVLGKVVSNQRPTELETKLALRAPYVAPLNILQVVCLNTIRTLTAKMEQGEEIPESNVITDPEILDLLSRDPAKADDLHPYLATMFDALIITIKGIASGMQNTG